LTPVKLIATDLDGTLLRSDGTISARTHSALTRAAARGVHVAVATARPFRALRPVVETSSIEGWGVCQNGAVIYELASFKRVHAWEMEVSLAKHVVMELRSAVDGVVFACEMDDLFHCEPLFESRLQAMEPPEVRYGDALELIVAPLTKLLAYHPSHGSAELAALAEAVIGTRAAVTHSGARFVEISAAGVTKASGVGALATRLGVDMSEIVAFGDMPNDLPMMAMAGRRIAVANAHPEVLACADDVALSNDDDGVAVVIEKMLDLEPV
jgi:Cof subfamily protein (haloacid dehalogenase superfamily)